MKYKNEFSQGTLDYIYESAKGRMSFHPDLKEKYTSMIDEYRHFKTEREALVAALQMWKSNPMNCQIWAKIEKDEEFYRIADWWIVTNDWKVKQAAEYIGMMLIYDEVKLCCIVDDNVPIDNIIE